MSKTILTLFTLIVWNGTHGMVSRAQTSPVPAAGSAASLQERIHIPEPADPEYRAAVEGLRKRIEAMPENTFAQKEDKLALRKYLETKLMEVEFKLISVMDEPDYRAHLDVMKKDLNRLPENTTARKRDKREILREFELRRLDVEVWRLSQGKTANSTSGPKK